jgi:pantoate--beta-alanine ligase
MSDLTVFRNIPDWLQFRKSLNVSLGFVPTMGALHEGHLQLIKNSQAENEKTVVSIFVNPTQFNDQVDFEKYPRTLDSDLESLHSLGCDFALLPQPQQMYPDNYNYQIQEKSLSTKFCGQFRPGHFEGMLTIVLKLLNITGATNAYFGEKDYQQFLLIKGMAEALFISTNIISVPTVRETSGLAMSSRNQRLSEAGKEKASYIFKTLKAAPNTQIAKTELENIGFKIDYIEDFNQRRFAAVFLEGVRLIDNVNI